MKLYLITEEQLEDFTKGTVHDGERVTEEVQVQEVTMTKIKATVESVLAKYIGQPCTEEVKEKIVEELATYVDAGGE